MQFGSPLYTYIYIFSQILNHNCPFTQSTCSYLELNLHYEELYYLQLSLINVNLNLRIFLTLICVANLPLPQPPPPFASFYFPHQPIPLTIVLHCLQIYNETTNIESTLYEGRQPFGKESLIYGCQLRHLSLFLLASLLSISLLFPLAFNVVGPYMTRTKLLRYEWIVMAILYGMVL